MKTSLYFVLWILVYPILCLDNPNTEAYKYSFFIALLVIFLISKVLAALMPATHTYEKEMPKLRLFEDAYNGNYRAISKEMTTFLILNTITGIYCAATLIVIFRDMTNIGDNFLAIILFAVWGGRSFGSAYENFKFRSILAHNPLQDGCAEVAAKIFPSEYEQYKEERIQKNFEEMLPARPRHYKGFLFFSTVAAAVAALLGLGLIVLCFLPVDGMAYSMMVGLYGALALYFGVKDLLVCSKSLKHDGGSNKQVVMIIVTSIIIAVGAIAYLIHELRNDALYDEIDKVLTEMQRECPVDMDIAIGESVSRDGNTVVLMCRTKGAEMFNTIKSLTSNPQDLIGIKASMCDNNDEFIDALLQSGISVRYVYYYDDKSNSVSITLSPDDIKQIKDMTEADRDSAMFSYMMSYLNAMLPMEYEDGGALTAFYVSGNNVVMSYLVPDLDIEALRDNSDETINYLQFEFMNDAPQYTFLKNCGYGLEYHYITEGNTDSIALNIFTPNELKSVMDRY